MPSPLRSSPFDRSKPPPPPAASPLRRSPSISNRSTLSSSSASARPDQLLVSRTLHYGLSTPANSPAAGNPTNYGLNKSVDDHKENNTDNAKGVDRSNQGWKAPPPKKPWVSNFAKVIPTPSPKKRILSERNEMGASSPLRSPLKSGANRENVEASDKRQKVTPEKATADLTPVAPVTGVAELQKRIQQFLQDQEDLLGVRNDRPFEYDEDNSVSVTPPSESVDDDLPPYHPVHSPFNSRPQFVRLHGAAVDVVEMVKAEDDEELPLFNFTSPTQKIRYASVDHAERAPNVPEETVGKALGEVALTEEGKERKEEEGEEAGQKGCSPVFKFAAGERVVEDEEAPLMVKAIEEEREVKEKEKEIESWPVDPRADTNVVSESLNVAEEATAKKSQRDELVSSGAAGSDSGIQAVDEELEDELEDVSWGAQLLGNLLCLVLLAAFVGLAVLASGSPGLLPSSLQHNAVSSLLHRSSYHQPAIEFLRVMDGLWIPELSAPPSYLPVDIRYLRKSCGHVKQKGDGLVLTVLKFFDQAWSGLELNFRTFAGNIRDWWGFFLHELLWEGEPHFEASNEEGAQFDWNWAEDYHMEEVWDDEDMMFALPDWELLQEYDLRVANELIMAPMSESEREELRRNFSSLSDSPEVKLLLSDLMKLKWGTEDDRSDVLEHLLEYASVSPSFQKSWMAFQDEPSVGSGENYEAVEEPSFDPEDKAGAAAEEAVGLVQEKHDIPGDCQEVEGMKIAKEPFKISREERQEISQIVDYRTRLSEGLESTEDVCLEETVNSEQLNMEVAENLEAFSAVPWQEETGELSSSEADAKIGERAYLREEAAIAHPDTRFSNSVKIISTLVVAALTGGALLLSIRFMQSKDTAPMAGPGIQFLKKAYQQPQQGSMMMDELQQHDKPVKLIEELNDRYASVLESPEPSNSNLWKTPVSREDEELIRSPLPGSVDRSPFGSFTTYKFVSKKEGQSVESKLTPVRRSNRLRNHISMSPSAVKRIAISPP